MLSRQSGGKGAAVRLQYNKTDDVFRKRDVLSENKRMNPQEAGGRPADGARGWTGLKLAL